MALKSVGLNAVMNTIRILSNMIFPLITFPYISRVLEPDGIGNISFATSFVGYFVLLASIGIPLYGVREIARVRDSESKLSELTQELFILHLFSSIIVTFLFILVVYFNEKFYTEKLLFIIVSSSIILTAVGMEWLYQGMEQYSYITGRSIAVSFLSTIAIFVFIHNKEDYLLSAVISVVGTLGSSILNFYNTRKILFAKRTVRWNFKRHLKPMSIVYLMNFIISIYVQLDTVMLGLMSSSKNVGYYATGLKINKMLLGLVTSLGAVLLPRLSYYLANDLKDDFNKLIKKSFEVIWILCLPVVAGLMLLSDEIILLFAGNQYLPAANCVIITAPIILLIGLTNIYGIQILYPLGRDKQVVFSVTIGAIVSFILNLFLIPHYSYIGAAVSTLVSELSVLIIMVFLIPHEYKFIVPFKNILRYLFATTLLIFSVLLIKNFIVPYLIRVFVAVPIGVLIYFGSLVWMKESIVMELVIKVKKNYTHQRYDSE